LSDHASLRGFYCELPMQMLEQAQVELSAERTARQKK